MSKEFDKQEKELAQWIQIKYHKASGLNFNEAEQFSSSLWASKAWLLLARELRKREEAKVEGVISMILAEPKYPDRKKIIEILKSHFMKGEKI